MIPQDYANRFKAERSTQQALARVICDMYKETLKTVMARPNKVLKVDDLDKTEVIFQAFLRKAGTFADGSPISKNIFKIVLQQLAPDVFEKWNAYHGNKLLTE